MGSPLAPACEIICGLPRSAPIQKLFVDGLFMSGQVTIADVRKTMEAQLTRLRKLEQDLQSATPPEQTELDSRINIIAQDIRNLDTILLGLVKPMPVRT